MNKIVPAVAPIATSTLAGKARAKICLITGDLAGLIVNAGVGTANRAMAVALRDLGYDIDVLYTRVDKGVPFTDRGQFIDHVEDFRQSGMKLMCLDNEGHWNDWQAISHSCLQHLLRQHYQIAFFDEMDGNAYYPLLARRTGNAKLQGTKICITTHASRQWFWDVNQRPFTADDLSIMEMERRCVELADAVKAPSAYILEKYRSYGWTLPNACIVIPNFIKAEGKLTKPPEATDVKELVFFGRLEARKGLWMFCRTLDRLKYKLKEYRVTFLGRSVTENGISTAEKLVTMSAGWPFAVQLITDFDRPQAIDYLRGPGRLAIMPGLEDNSPSTILECLEAGVPFIACDSGGAAELLDEESQKSNLFGPSVNEFSAKLLKVLSVGVSTARASFSHSALQAKFAEWIERLLRQDKKEPKLQSTSQIRAKPILITVVPAEFDAAKAIVEIQKVDQDFEGNLEIIVLAANRAEIASVLASARQLGAIQVFDLTQFRRLAEEIAGRGSTVVGLCHITQMLSPPWFERTRACFELEKGISAVTGMLAVKKRSVPATRAPYVSPANEPNEVDRFLMGNAPPLFPLSQETNSGFVLLRSEAFAVLTEIGPVDRKYERLKQLEEWIHEILVVLHASGKHFELVPDYFARHRVEEVPFEALRLGHFLRSSPALLWDYAPGSDSALLSRLAIDAGLERLRSKSHAEYRRQVAERIGMELTELHQFAPWEQQAQQLIKIAHGSGQTDLAVDICATLAVSNGKAPSDLTEHIRSAARSVAGALSLAVLFAREEFVMLNVLRGEPSGDWRAFDLPVNPPGKGLAALLFPSVDLGGATHFACMIEALEHSAEPIRFRLEVVSVETTHRVTSEKILRGGETHEWKCELARELSGRCNITLGVEFADWNDSSVEASTRWTDPVLVRRS